MLISCENCSTKYLVPDESIGAAGRLVKCSNCGHKWVQYPQSPDIRTRSEPYEDLPRNKSLQALPSGEGVSIKFILATALLFLIFISLAFVAAFPNVKSDNSLYEKVGLFRTDGLEFKDIEFRKVKREDKYVLVIKGAVVNTGDKPVNLNGIRIIITDDKDKKMTSLVYENDKKTINPGERIPFEPKIANVPENAQKIFVDIGNGLELFFRKTKI